MGACLTRGSDAIPVLLRPCSALLCTPAIRAASADSAPGEFRFPSSVESVPLSRFFDSPLIPALLHPQALSWLCLVAPAASSAQVYERWRILVSRLSTVLKGIVTDKVSKESITSAEVASAASSRPDGVSRDTGGSVKMALLCNAFLDELLSPVLLNHV